MIGLMALLIGASDPRLAPLDFLVGHCWRGNLPKAGQQDTHCFTRLDDGRIRDAHKVTSGGATLFSGETYYRWDPAARAVGYVYTDDAKGRMTGTVKPGQGGRLDFDDGIYVGNDGSKIAIKVTWTPDRDGWIAAESSADMPALDRTTRYARID